MLTLENPDRRQGCIHVWTAVAGQEGSALQASVLGILAQHLFRARLSMRAVGWASPPLTARVHTIQLAVRVSPPPLSFSGTHQREEDKTCIKIK